MTGSLTPFLGLVTSEHNTKPNYISMLSAFLQPVADGIDVANGLVTLFDVDNAAGVQLDAIGLWVGASRYLSEPISGVYFQFDIGPGFDLGALRGPFDPSNTLVRLPDPQYRTLINATIAANHWDGTILGAYNAYAVAFGPGGYRLTIIDNQDMTETLVLTGPTPDAITLALFTGGYLDLRPDGVGVKEYVVPSAPGAKIFMFDATPGSAIFGGFDTAAFGKVLEGT